MLIPQHVLTGSAGHGPLLLVCSKAWYEFHFIPLRIGVNGRIAPCCLQETEGTKDYPRRDESFSRASWVDR